MRRKASVFVLLPAVAVTVMALVFSWGCGGKRDYAGELLKAAEKAVDAGSFHAQFNAVLTPLEGTSGMGMTVQGDAWLDMEPVAAEARLTVLGMEISLRYAEEVVYLQMGGQWYEVPSSTLQEMGLGKGTLAAAMEVLASAPGIVSSASAVSETGLKKVGGYECTELAVSPDLQAVAGMEAVRKLAGELDMSEEELAAWLTEADPEIHVCVQRDELVIRQIYLAFSMELPEVAGLMGLGLLPERARVEMTMDLPEYGMDVEVEAPANAKPFRGF